MAVAGTTRTTRAFIRAAAALCALGAWTALAPAHAVQLYPESAVKAAFVLRFAGYVEWPSDVVRDEFHIAVLADPSVARNLEELADGRNVAGRPVRISQVSSARAAREAQVLVVGPAHRMALRELLRPLTGGSVLVVTSETDALSAGSTINFLREQDRLRFEVSLPAARRMGLRVSSELLSVAARVER